MPQRLALLFCLPGIALGAHPLISDDTGTQGAGGWQIELNADYAHEPDTALQQRVGNATLTYGAGDALDLFVNATALRAEAYDEAERLIATRGAGDVSVGGKWRLYENDDWSLAIKGTLNLPTGDDERGLGNGLPFYAVSAVSTLQAGDWVLLANAVGLYFSGEAPDLRKWQWSASVGAGYEISDAWQLLGELVVFSGAEAGVNENPGLLTLGVVYRMLPTLDFDVGYRYGLMDSAIDHSLGAGLAFRW